MSIRCLGSIVVLMLSSINLHRCIHGTCILSNLHPLVLSRTPRLPYVLFKNEPFPGWFCNSFSTSRGMGANDSWQPCEGLPSIVSSAAAAAALHQFCRSVFKSACRQFTRCIRFYDTVRDGLVVFFPTARGIRTGRNASSTNYHVHYGAAFFCREI